METAGYLDRAVCTKETVTMFSPTHLDGMSDLSLTKLDFPAVTSTPKPEKFLRGCKVFLRSFSDFDRKWFNNIITSLGGMTFSTYHENVSHVICGIEEDPLMKKIASVSGPHVVSYHWLIDCCKNRRIVDEKPFYVSSVASDVQNSQIIATTKCLEKIEHRVWRYYSKTTMSEIFYEFVDGFSDVMKEQLVPNKKINCGEMYKCDVILANKMITNKEEICPQNEESSSLSFYEETEEENSADRKELIGNQEQEWAQSAENDTLSLHDETSEDNFRDAPSSFDDGAENWSFKGMKFTLIGFGPGNSDFLGSLIERKGGMVCGLETPSVDVAVVPVHWGEPETNAKHIVTNCWLQKCVEDEELLPFYGNPLFTPLSIKSSVKPLRECVITISQLDGTERDCLKHIALLLGAVYQDYLSRGNSRRKELWRNTHLIAKRPEGDKYESAKKWKIPVVTTHWLIAAARNGELPPSDHYLVDETTSGIDDDTRVHDENGLDASVQNSVEKARMCRNATDENDFTFPKGRNLSRHEKSVKNFSSEESSADSVTKLADDSAVFGNKTLADCNAMESQFLNSDIQYQPYFDVFDMLQYFETPDDQDKDEKGLTRSTIPLEEMFSHNLSIALMNFKVDDDILEVPLNMKSQNPNMCDVHGQDIEPPLNGVILCVSKTLGTIQDELCTIVSSLGGDCCGNCYHCTHFVFRGEEHGNNWEYRLARTEGKNIVSPEWVYACRDQKKHLREYSYPHPYEAGLVSRDEKSALRSSSSEYETAPEENDDDVHDGGDAKSQQSDICEKLDELIDVLKEARKKKNVQSLRSPKDCSVPSVFGESSLSSRGLKSHVELLNSRKNCSREDVSHEDQANFPEALQGSAASKPDPRRYKPPVILGAIRSQDTRVCRLEKSVRFNLDRLDNKDDRDTQKDYHDTAAPQNITRRRHNFKETWC